jgi:MFS family permease
VTESPPAHPAEEVPRRRVLIVIAALMLTMLLAALDQTIVSTALPTIVGELGGLNHLSWVVTSYLLAITVVTPLYGKLGDLYGRKLVLQVAIVLFLIGSALCGLSQNMAELIEHAHAGVRPCWHPSIVARRNSCVLFAILPE